MIFSVLNKVVFWLNVFAALALLVSYVSPYVNPDVFWPIAFFGLAYPVLIVANLIFIVYWLLRAKLWIFISLAPVIFGFGHVFKYVQFSSDKSVNKEKSIKVLSMNVGFFRNVNQNAGEKKREMDHTFLDFIGKENPDIIIMQEFTPYFLFNGQRANTAISNALSHKSYHKFRDSAQTQVIFSRFPILKSGTIAFPGKNTVNGAMWVDIKKGTDTVRIYNVHLQSFRLDKQFSMDRISSSEEAVSESKNIVRRIRNGNTKRAAQVKLILEAVAKCPHRIILAGDFNDTPMSFAYHKFSAHFRDAFMEAGSGLGATYVGPYPSYRIDYIMSSPEVKAKTFKRGPNFISDHRMVVSELELE